MSDMYVVIGKDNCPWCEKAKELLADTGNVFEYFDINKDPAMRHFLVSSGLSTVPQVYLDGELVGGFDDLKASLEED